MTISLTYQEKSSKWHYDSCQLRQGLTQLTPYGILTVEDVMPVSFRSELFTSYNLTILKQ